MIYRLEFKISAQKEWQKLDSRILEQFKKKLIERLAQPRIESARLAAMPDCYKIKLRAEQRPSHHSKTNSGCAEHAARLLGQIRR